MTWNGFASVTATPPRTLPVAEFVARFGPHIGGARRRAGDWQRTAARQWELRPDHMAELTDSIAAEGIRVPVRVGRLHHHPRYVVIDGHHRVSVAVDLAEAGVEVDVPYRVAPIRFGD